MSPASWLSDAVARFGADCKAKLAGPGDPEAAIRSPLESLLAEFGSALDLKVVPHDEVRDTLRGVRPDYGISVNGVITGYIEVKRPGANLDPSSFTGHNRRQWERLRDLPNLVYTNGVEWRLWRDGEQWGDLVHLAGGPLGTAGSGLQAYDSLEWLVTEFLRWKPQAITSVLSLVRAIAPLTRLLRGEVADQLAAETQAVTAGRARPDEQPFTGLAKDWRQLLFPTADNAKFADGYAQTVTFALLLARTEGIDISELGSLHEVGSKLSGQHSLMARALQLLTDYVAKDFAITLDLLVRVIGAVDWNRVRKGKRDTYLHLYERFLELYDPDLRKLSGSYYTPRPVVEQMVRLTEQVLVTRLDRSGFNDDSVVVVDPAMGTGTYLHTVIEHVAGQVADADGPGAVPGEIHDLAKRLYGFELQMGPFAVAELRATDLLADLGAPLPRRGLGLYVTNTLDDPYAAQAQLGSGLELISQSMRRANRVKAKTNVTVVIGNPPYRERAEGAGGWIENGVVEETLNRTVHPLDAFRVPGNGRNEYVLKNLYIYFWRWATWKVFDHHPQAMNDESGVVCFITTSGYLRGPGFKGMREYLRRTCSEGWIIDVTPEGMQPDVPTRIFPSVQQPLAIAIFVRQPDTTHDEPAAIHYTSMHGRQADKFQALASLDLDDTTKWRLARPGWEEPFTPAADGAWDTYPAANDLLPWTQPGVKANRVWVYAPDPAILSTRWTSLQQAPEADRPDLFKPSRDSALSRAKEPLPAPDTEQASTSPLAQSFPERPAIVRVGYRSFDRQWLIADPRVIDQPRPPLWAARVPGQVYVVEQHTKVIKDGPGLTFSALIPDMDFFRGSEGGRSLPFLHADGSANLAPQLPSALSSLLNRSVSDSDVLAYIAGVVSHPGYTATFTDELTTPGVRVPVTSDAELWDSAVTLGRQVIWLHTYGAAGADPARNRPANYVRFPPTDARRIVNLTAVTSMPGSISYDPTANVIHIGTGSFGPVPEDAWNYSVGGRNVIASWFNYRKAIPGGRKTSPLDTVHTYAWPSDWNGELIDLLTVLTRLVDLEADQAELLDAILEGPLLSRETLAERGVRWPGAAMHPSRKPRLRKQTATSDPSVDYTLY